MLQAAVHVHEIVVREAGCQPEPGVMQKDIQNDQSSEKIWDFSHGKSIDYS